MSTKIDVKKGDSDPKEKKSREIEVRRDQPYPLSQRMESFFDDLRMDVGNWLLPRPFRSILSDEQSFFRNPLANIEDSKDAYKIKAELPGTSKDDISVTLLDNNLEIRSERKEEKTEEKGDYLRREYTSSNFYRCFTVPNSVDKSAIDAQFDKGVLSIKLPKIKTKEKERTKIPVK